MLRIAVVWAGVAAVSLAAWGPAAGQAAKETRVAGKDGSAARAETAGGGPAAPGLVDRLRGRGARVTGLGEVGGLSGWLVEPRGGEPYTLYVTGGGHAVAGLLYGPEGGALTGAQLRRVDGDARRTRGRDAAGEAAGDRRVRESEVRVAHVPGAPAAAPDGYSVVRPRLEPPAKPAPRGLLARSADLMGFTIGHRGPTAVMFADPLCPWSRDAVDKLRVEAAKRRFRLRVIPVGLLGEKSARAAVRIVSSPDPMLAWFGRDVAGEHRAGGMWIEESNGVFDEWGENAVPLLAWRDREKGPVYRVGTVRDAGEWLLEAYGQ